MKKPPYYPQIVRQSAKPALLWKESYARLRQLFIDPSSLRPAVAAGEPVVADGLSPRRRPLPRLKSNVYQTMKEILRLFMGTWHKAKKEINYSVRTTYSSLAQLCRNFDPKTAYLHVLTLIEHGFLRAKARLSHGVQLLLTPAVLVFDPTSAPPAGRSFPVVPVLVPHGNRAPVAPQLATALPNPSDLAIHLAQLATKLKTTFSNTSVRHTSVDLIGEKPRH